MHDALQHFLTALQSPDTFNQIKLMGNPKPFPLHVAREVFGEPLSAALTSISAANGLGGISAKDIVMWRTGDGVNVATVVHFVEAVTKEGKMHKALVHMHKRCGLAAWSIEETHTSWS